MSILRTLKNLHGPRGEGMKTWHGSTVASLFEREYVELLGGKKGQGYKILI